MVHEKGLEDLREAARDQKRRRPAVAAAAAVAAAPPATEAAVVNSEQAAARAAGPAAISSPAEAAVADAELFEVKGDPDGTLWKLMWVEVDSHLAPRQPLRVKPLGQASRQSREVAVVGSEGASLGSGGSGSIVVAPAGGNSESSVGFGHLLNDVHSMIKAFMDPNKHNKWRADLPKISVKETYLSFVGPPAKGDDVDGKPVLRAYWPSALKGDMVDDTVLDKFMIFLKKNMNKKEDFVESILVYIGRVLGSLEFRSDKEDNTKDIASTEALVAFYVSDEYKKFLEMELMDPKYAWTIKTIDSLTIYCQFHFRELAQKVIR